MRIRHIKRADIYFLPLFTKYNIRATIATTTMTPVQIPALNIPAMASQLVMVNTKKNRTLNNDS